MTADEDVISALIRIAKANTSEDAAIAQVDDVIQRYFAGFHGDKEAERGRIATALGDQCADRSLLLVSVIQEHLVGIRRRQPADR